jgi:hypothetical protein
MVAIRHARRGALAAAFIFGILVVIASEVAPPVATTAPGIDTIAGSLIALISLPGLALLGAGLTSAALGSRWSAASAGLAMGVGVPVAAVTSAMIGAFIVVGFVRGADNGAGVAGTVLTSGVTAAVRISPLIAAASAAWVLLVRRMARRRSAHAEATVRNPDKVCPPVRPTEWWDSMEDLGGRSMDIPCDFAPRAAVWTCVRDTITDTGGMPRRVDEHDPAASTDVTCTGFATIWDTTLPKDGGGYGGGDVFVCAEHDRWLRDHWWIDSMSSGTNMKVVNGVWTSTRFRSA